MRSDAVRIVPLKLPEGARAQAQAATPLLTYRNGPLLGAVEVFALFWGSAWNTTSPDVVVAINNFLGYVVTSSLLDQLAEYSSQTTKIGHGSYLGSKVVASPEPPATLSDAALRTFLQDQINSASGVPQPGANTLYFIYLPSGVTVELSGSHSCQDFCGYHDAIGSTVFYAVEPYPDCSGCSASFAITDALTITSSHELCEAITDPIPGQGWYDDANGEIGDICAWQTKRLGSYTVQLEWSNQAKRCL